MTVTKGHKSFFERNVIIIIVCYRFYGIGKFVLIGYNTAARIILIIKIETTVAVIFLIIGSIQNSRIADNGIFKYHGRIIRDKDIRDKKNVVNFPFVAEIKNSFAIGDIKLTLNKRVKFDDNRPIITERI